MRRSLSICTALAVLVLAGTAWGGGYEIQEHSARSLANAIAGRAAIAEDAVTVFHNPAGMTRLKGFSGVAGLHLILADVEFNDDNSTNWMGGPLTGDDGDFTGTNFVPALYITQELNSWLAVGLGVNAPFGLSTEYDDDWKGRYFALDTELKTMNINPGIAAKPFEGIELSIGVGVSYQTADATLSNAIDFGTIGYSQLGSELAGELGLVPEMTDGEVEVEGDGDSWGWNFGLLYEFNECTRIGFAYRSHVHHKLEGDADFDVPVSAVPLTQTGRFLDTDASARVTLPEQYSLSIFHDIDENWSVMADVTYTRWSRFEELRIKFDNPAQPDAVTEEEWDDTWRFSVGAIYRLDEHWTFRAGLAWDESPIDDKYRTARIPTNDRFWVAIGVGYRFNENFAVDLSYLHVFMKEGEINETASTNQVLDGDYDFVPDVFGLQLTVNF
jgi:long-chain fatty acid transport protein